MIDIHAHIMPGIDDGAETMREAIHMLRTASEKGVHTIAVTPHCNIEGLYENYYDECFFDRFHKLEAEIVKEKIAVKIVPGMEVYASEEVPELLQKGRIITLNGSRYLLIEFGNQKDLPLINFVINELVALGYIPIIAHPERYPYVHKIPVMASQWLEKGCLLQVNKGSILGSFGRHARNTAIYMLKHNMVSFIASDAHSSLMRNTDMSAVYDFIRNNYSEETAHMLLEVNPGKVIYNHDFAEQRLMLN
jgi:protein-tyrosine phosphatase